MRPEERARYVLSLMGLAARAGTVVSGTGNVREAVRKGTMGFVLVARDAAEGQKRKIAPLLLARQVFSREAYTKAELGAAIGRSQVSVVGVETGPLADRLRQTMVGIADRVDRGYGRELD